jgi:hypothetical protein
MTPDQFANGADQWIDAVTTVLVHFGGKLMVLATGLASVYLWLQQRGLTARLDAHKGQLDALAEGLAASGAEAQKPAAGADQPASKPTTP